MQNYGVSTDVKRGDRDKSADDFIFFAHEGRQSRLIAITLNPATSIATEVLFEEFDQAFAAARSRFAVFEDMPLEFDRGPILIEAVMCV